MEKEFVQYQEALALKEFNIAMVSFGQYWRDKDDKKIYLFTGDDMVFEDYDAPGLSDIEFICEAPLKQQAFRWFREKYGYYISVFRTHDGNWGTDLWLLGVHKPKATVFGETYEEAELECLKKLIEIVKQ